MRLAKIFRVPHPTPRIIDLRKARRKRRRLAPHEVALFGAAFTAVFVGGLAATNREAVATAPQPTYSAQFDLCAGERLTCVVDGDTFWLEGRKIRVADIDTPEVSHLSVRSSMSWACAQPIGCATCSTPANLP